MKAFRVKKILVLFLLLCTFFDYFEAALGSLTWFPRFYFQAGGAALYAAGIWVVFFHWKKPKVFFVAVDPAKP